MIRDLLLSPSERRRAEEFSELLEGHRPGADHELASLVRLTASLSVPAPMPASDFSAALRARLVQASTERPSSTLVPLQRTPSVTEAHPRRLRQAVAAAAVVAVLGGAGAATASTRALPGDSLYGLKRGIESVQLSLATSDLSRGREQLQQADARLGEAERLAGTEGAVGTETRSRIERALEDMDASVRDGAATLTEVYQETGDVTALEILDGFVVDQQRRLAPLLERLADIDSGLRDAAAATAVLLRSLHAEVDALTRTTSALTTSSGPSGAARDPNVSGDGEAVSRIPTPADGAEQAPPATADSGEVFVDLTGDDAQDTGGVQAPTVPPPTPAVPDAGASAGTTVDPQQATTLPTPTQTLPTPPATVPGGAVPVPLPCVPIAPLTSC